MKKKLLGIFSCLLLVIALVISNIGTSFAKEVNIDEILESKSYKSLSYVVKEFIRDYYEENGIVLLTKDLADAGSSYLNPEYIKYLDSKDKSKYYVIPSITAYTPVTKTSYTKRGTKSQPSYPSSFDLRNVNEINYVTPNKDQGNEGLCWAYATSSLLETHDLMVKNVSYNSNAVLFSEKQMDYALSSNGIVGGNKVVTSASRKLGDGNDFTSVEKYLSLRLIGVNDSWTIDNNNLVSQNTPLEPNIVFNRNNVIYEVDETTRLLNINEDPTNTELNETMKNLMKDAVYNHGGALINITVGNGHTVNNVYNLPDYINIVNPDYTTSSLFDGQHALHIVGWNDDYQYGFCAYDFGNGHKSVIGGMAIVDGEMTCNDAGPDVSIQKVVGTGAWILKNSWGSEYSYVYLPYDSFIDGVVIVNSYSEKNWDNNYDLSNPKFSITNNELALTYDFTKYGVNNNETIKKIKVNVQDQDPIAIYFSSDGSENNFSLIGNYSYDYAGYKVINLENENIVVNSNSKIRITTSGAANLEVFTSNSNSNPMAYTMDYSYTLDEEKPSSANYLNIYGNSYVRNISDNTQITYKIKDSQDNYLPNSAYEVTHNKSYNGMVTPTIKLYSNYINIGTLYLDTIKNNDVLYTSPLIFEVDFMPIFGSGTSEDPWQIENTRQFHMINNAQSDYYILKNDIDFEFDTHDPDGLFYNSGSGWSGIRLSGNLDGNGKTIKNIKTSSGLFQNVSINDNCKFDSCGLHDINVDNIEISYASTEKGGVINNLTITNAYYANVDNISATNVVFNSNTSNYLGGIVGTIGLNDYNGDLTLTIMKINNWYSDVYFKGTQYPQGFTAHYIGGLVGRIWMYGNSRTAYLSLNNAKSNARFNLNNHFNKEYHISDIVGVIQNDYGNVILNNIIGNASYEDNNNANFTVNAFVGMLDSGSGSNIINGAKSTFGYYSLSGINISNYEAGLKPYELARANYEGIEYYEDQYFAYNTSHEGATKVEFKDRFDVFEDKIPTLKALPENYSDYYKSYSIRVNQEKSIEDLISNDTNYRNLKVYSSFNCNLDLCNNITDETIISVPTEENGYVFAGLKSGTTTLILYDELSGYLDSVVINVLTENQYAVTFDSNGGSSVAGQVVNYNETITRPTNPTRDGYTFVEWQLNGNTYNFNTPVTSDITLTAVWELYQVPQYTVTFNSNGGSSVASQTVNYSGTATEPINPTRTGYTFVEWQLSGNTYNFNTPVTSNIILTAVWQINQYTVTFDSNGGSSVASQTVNYNATVTKPTAPTRTGYTFVEWQLNGNAYYFDKPVTSDITLTAVWQIKKYTVTFNSNGGSSVASQTVNYNGKATKPSNPTKTGYTFVEWQLNGNTYNFNTAVTGNITLTAVWQINQYTITFDSNGGSSVASQTVNYNGKATKPSNPTRTGYDFVEWQLNGNTYNFNTAVTENITLTAVWQIKKYTVTFNSNGGSSVASQTVNYNGKATKPSNPTKDGYTFVEWQLNGNTYNFNTAVTGNITLAAVWQINQYTITFDSNGGSSVASQTVNYNGKATTPTNPTKDGYTFVEWQLNGNTYNFNTAVTGNITLTAVWQINEILQNETLKDILEDNSYNITNNLVSGFRLGMTPAELKNQLGDSSIIVNTNNTVISTGAVIKKGNESYTIVIKGDLTGDGKINSGDLLQMRKYLLEEVSLTGAYKQAGIIESNSEIKSLDLLRLRQYLLDEYVIK